MALFLSWSGLQRRKGGGRGEGGARGSPAISTISRGRRSSGKYSRADIFRAISHKSYAISGVTRESFLYEWVGENEVTDVLGSGLDCPLRLPPEQLTVRRQPLPSLLPLLLLSLRLSIVLKGLR
eukprot:Sspe_Gene.287::Locus_96_Transcript_2_2_Confidence_0.600_Length_2397::g.287::m.287